MSVMDMSDDELAALSDSQIEALIAKEEAEALAAQEKPETQEEGAPNEQPTTPDEGEAPEQPETPLEDGADKPDEGEQPDGAEAPEGDAKPEEGGKPEGEKPSEEAEPGKKPEPVDYEGQVKKILAPFKANGRQIQVDSVEDAIQLMQQGANYHKKMEGLKPRLATLKLLEREGLLEGDKLGYLIDLAKGDKGAINRLVKEHGVDTLEIDASKADQYRANQYHVDEAAVELDNVIADLRESPHYANLMDVVGNKWDNASHQELAKKPEQLRDIHAHMELGVFDRVQDRVATERALGRLNGLSSLEAYRTVGERMYKEGQFNGSVTQTKSAPTKIAAVKPASTQAPASDDSKKKKLAASPSGTKSVVKVEEEFDPLNMSDEDFLKHQAKFNIR